MRLAPRPAILAALACTLALSLSACGEHSTPATKSTDVTPPQPAQQTVPAAPAPAPAAQAPKADPDAELAARVKSAFASDPQLKMLPIDVRASNGTVTLYGTADSARLRDKAIHTAEAVDGVKSVSANLQIVRGS
ncbi:MAG TPA: BON domain-containing protein [Burkholderiales bacterium]